MKLINWENKTLELRFITLALSSANRSENLYNIRCSQKEALQADTDLRLAGFDVYVYSRDRFDLPTSYEYVKDGLTIVIKFGHDLPTNNDKTVEPKIETFTIKVRYDKVNAKSSYKTYRVSGKLDDYLTQALPGTSSYYLKGLGHISSSTLGAWFTKANEVGGYSTKADYSTSIFIGTFL